MSHSGGTIEFAGTTDGAKVVLLRLDSACPSSVKWNFSRCIGALESSGSLVGSACDIKHSILFSHDRFFTHFVLREHIQSPLFRIEYCRIVVVAQISTIQSQNIIRIGTACNKIPEFCLNRVYLCFFSP